MLAAVTDELFFDSWRWLSRPFEKAVAVTTFPFSFRRVCRVLCYQNGKLACISSSFLASIADFCPVIYTCSISWLSKWYLALCIPNLRLNLIYLRPTKVACPIDCMCVTYNIFAYSSVDYWYLASLTSRTYLISIK